jgi:anaerobic selenocysteine-containing dehydrogenase
MLGAAKLDTYISNIFGRIGAPALAEVAAEAITRICPGDTTFNAQFVQQNTLGAYAAFSGGGGKVLESLAEGKLKALVLLGVDIFSEYPAAELEKALREDTFTLATQMFRGTTAARANVVIPAASLIEKEGTVFPEFEEKIVRTKDDIIEPPGGVVTDGHLLEALSETMGKPIKLKGCDIDIKRSGSGDWLSEEWVEYLNAMKEIDAAETVLIPLSDPVHVGDGSISRMLSWSRRTSPEPVLVIPLAMAEALNLSEGEEVTVKTDGGSGIFKTAASGRMSEGTIGIYIHYPEARMLFPWKLDKDKGELALMPVGAEISREEKKS